MKAATPNVLVGWVEGIASPAGDEACDLTCRSLPYWSHRSMDETLSGRPGSGGRPLLAASSLPGDDAERTERTSIRCSVVCGVGATRSHSCGLPWLQRWSRRLPLAAGALRPFPQRSGPDLANHPGRGLVGRLAILTIWVSLFVRTRGSSVGSAYLSWRKGEN